MMTENTISERLQAIRNTLELKSKDMAKSLGVSNSAYSLMEQGNQNVSAAVAEMLYRTFNVDMNYLFLGEGNMFRKPPFEDFLTDLAALSKEISSISNFLKYFAHSEIVRFYILSTFQIFYLEKQKQIESQMKPDDS